MRWIFRILGLLVVLALVAVGLVFLLPAERLASVVTDRFEAATGRSLEVAGRIRPSFYPEIGVTAGPITLANADWGSDAPLLTAERLRIGVDLAGLLSGAFNVRSVVIDAPVISLETQADGTGNWELASAPAGGSDEGAPQDLPPISLDRGRIREGQITFTDGATGQSHTLSAVDLRAKIPSLDGAITAKLAAEYKSLPITADIALDDLEAFLAGAARPLKLDLGLGSDTVSFDGSAGLDPLTAQARLKAEIADTDALATGLGAPAPGLPEGLGARLGLATGLTLSATEIALDVTELDLGGNAVKGKLTLTLGDRPTLTGRLNAGALNLSALSEGGETSGEASQGWPKDPIDVSALGLIDADLVLTADSVDLGTAKLGRTRLANTLEAGRLVTQIRKLAAYEGEVTGRLVVNSRGGLSVRAEIEGKSLAMSPLLTDLAGFSRLATTGDFALNVLGSGASVDAIVQSLDGEGQFRFGQGEITGLDLAAMVRNFDPSFVGEGKRTIFSSIAASYAITKGQLTNEDLAFDAPLLQAKGAGQVDLAGQGLDYRVTPTLLPGEEGTGLSLPILFTGPWAAPKIRPDLEGVTRDQIEAEAAKVVDRIEEEIDKAKENAGEDLKNRAEDALRDGLGRLLRQ